MTTRAPELDAEQEVDLGRYGRAIVTRWWLPAGGFAVGAIVGYLVSLGGTQLFKATSTVYLGQPYSIVGGTLLQGPQTNPTTVSVIIHSEQAVENAARAAGMPASRLRGHISTKTITTGAAGRGGAGERANPPLPHLRP